MVSKILSTILGLLTSLTIFAGTMGDADLSSSTPLYIGGYGGYGHIDGGYHWGANTTMGRLAIGLHLKEYHALLFGAEVGFQSGNTMRLYASPETIDLGGGLPIQSTLKPMVDFLVSVKGRFTYNSPIFYLLKGGVAFRQLELEDRSSPSDTLHKFNGEFQGGLGYAITNHVLLTAFYQGIYSSPSAGIQLDTTNDVSISKIPTQQAGFLGLEYSFD